MSTSDSPTHTHPPTQVATNYDGVPGADAESVSDARAYSDFAANADAVSTSEAVGGTFGDNASSISIAEADGVEFGGAGTLAQAYGRRDASALADSIAISEEFGASD